MTIFINGVSPASSASVTAETTYSAPSAVGTATTYSKGDHTHGTPVPNKSILNYRLTGEVNDRYYGSSITGLNTATASPTKDNIFALPFITIKSVTLDTIWIEITVFGGGTARLGIYNDDGSGYPGTLLLDAGTVNATSNGVKTISINQVLNADSLYWLVYNSENTNGVRSWNAANLSPINGYLSTGGSATMASFQYQAASVYGAFPTPFPAGASINQAFMVMILVRLST